MWVVVMDEQIISPERVCQHCLMADQSGHPRGKQGKLRCARRARLRSPNSLSPDHLVECQMGFMLTNVD